MCKHPWMPTNEEINKICNEDTYPDYQPAEFSFVTNPELIRKIIEISVIRGKIEELEATYMEDGNLPPLIKKDLPIPIVVAGKDIRKRMDRLGVQLAKIEKTID